MKIPKAHKNTNRLHKTKTTQKAQTKQQTNKNNNKLQFLQIIQNH